MIWYFALALVALLAFAHVGLRAGKIWPAPTEQTKQRAEAPPGEPVIDLGAKDEDECRVVLEDGREFRRRPLSLYENRLWQREWPLFATEAAASVLYFPSGERASRNDGARVFGLISQRQAERKLDAEAAAHRARWSKEGA